MADVSESDRIREAVRAAYAAAAQAAATGPGSACCDAGGAASAAEAREPLFGAALYASEEGGDAAPAALSASLGCGVPTAVAELEHGETVLDLGSGAGADVLISARRVGATGRAIGLDMTEEMLELARSNAASAAVGNAEFIKGEIENIPLPNASVDVVISNCVINLSAEKQRVLREAARVLRPGGRLAVADVVADADMDELTRVEEAAWTGCIAGALTREQYVSALAAAGFTDISISESHRVHEHAAAAIVRARKPAEPCCSSAELGGCCEPQDRVQCCGDAAGDAAAAPGRCGCRAGRAAA
jgi:ubiquinone/menaquinone biosynthesis C-methylase UbiE